MLLTSTDGTRVELSIDGYEFPGHEPDGPEDYDANWLQISGGVDADGRRWTFRDPALTTWDASDLLELLRMRPRRRGRPLEFVEPNLRFLLEPEDQDEVRLTVIFGAESAPPDTSSEDRWGNGYSVALALTHGDLAAAAQEWEKELAAFPAR